jgi:hypothetical protein
VSRECHDHAGHVLVATWDRDAGVVVLRTCNRLDAVGYYLAGLQTESHSWSMSANLLVLCAGVCTFSTHRNAITHSNSVVLPCEHVVLLNMILDLFPKVQHCSIISPLAPRDVEPYNQ